MKMELSLTNSLEQEPNPKHIWLCIWWTYGCIPPMGLDEPYELSFYVYVPSGNSAYFNMQENLTVQVGWAFDIVLDAQGNVSLGIDQVVLAQTTYTLMHGH